MLPKIEHEIETTKGRRRAMRHFLWMDHAILRYKWTNFDQVAEGVFRSNHPGHERLKSFADMGGKTILTLRGKGSGPSYLLEAESCRALGLKLEVIGMAARRAPKPEALAQLLEAFKTLEKPFLMHCKSGADRTGLAAALYLMIHEGRSVEDVKDQLSFKYIHIRKIQTGILDHFLRLYAAHNAQNPIGIEDWSNDHYDPDALTQSFEQRQASLKPWQGWR